jgi:hypothetical protein
VRALIELMSKKSGSAGRGPADPLAVVGCLRSVVRSGAGGQENRAAANRSYAAELHYDIALRRPLDDKLAKLRHQEIKNFRWRTE